MKIESLLTAALVASTVACSALVGIRDVKEDPGGGVDADADPDPLDATDASRKDGAAPLGLDAGAGAFTGGEAHFLQPAESVVVGYTSAAGAAKELELSANGAFTFPETAYDPTVKTPAANKRCWLRPLGGGKIDVRCVVAPDLNVTPGTTSSATFVPLAGAELALTTDLPNTNLFIVFSVPYITTSKPLTGNFSTAYVRAIVDGDATKSIDLTRGSTYWSQGYNHTLFGTIAVGPGAHKVAIEMKHYVAVETPDRVAVVGGNFSPPSSSISIDYIPKLAAVALESMETFAGLKKTAQNDPVPLTDKNVWRTMTTLSGSAPAPAKALVTAYYPEVAVGNPPSPTQAAWFSLMSGTTPIASFDFRHYDETAGGVRSVGMLTSIPISGPFDLHVDQQTEWGPNSINAPKAGGALAALLFSATSSLQSWTFGGDYNLSMAVGEWRPVAGSKATVTTKERSLVFASVSRICTTVNGGAAELGLFDGDTELAIAHTEGWGSEIAQGSIFASVVDFATPGEHTVELRVRKLNSGIPLVRHSTVPDNRGVSSITVLPLE